MLLSKLLLMMNWSFIIFIHYYLSSAPQGCCDRTCLSDNPADVYLVIDDVIHSCFDFDVLLNVHSDVVVCNAQLDVDDVLILIFDLIFVSNVVDDHDVLCISLLDGFLSPYVVCTYIDDVYAVFMSRSVVADVEAVFLS